LKIIASTIFVWGKGLYQKIFVKDKPNLNRETSEYHDCSEDVIDVRLEKDVRQIEKVDSARDRMKLNDKLSYRKIPLMDCLIILVVTVVTLFLNLAIAVGIGVVIAVFVFAWNSSNSVQSNTFIKCSERTGQPRMKVVELSGPIYFGTRSRFLRFFSPETDPDLVEIHFRHSDIHDFSGIHVINKLGADYAEHDKKLILRNIREQSMTTIQHVIFYFSSLELPKFTKSDSKIQFHVHSMLKIGTQVVRPSRCGS
jgi:hypothetical protein